jgi:hypothetical protein
VRAQRTISIAQSRPSGCRSAGSLSLPATSRRAIALATRHKPGRRPADERSATQAIATRPSAGRSQRRKSITRGERTARSQCLRTHSTAGPRVSRLVDGFRVLEAGALSVAPRHREQPRGREAIPWLVLSERSSPGDPSKAAALVRSIQEFVASGGGAAVVGAATVLHRRGGWAAVAVSVGVAGGVPLQLRAVRCAALLYFWDASLRSAYCL